MKKSKESEDKVNSAKAKKALVEFRRYARDNWATLRATVLSVQNDILRQSDKISFMIGVVGTLMTEYVVLKRPSFFPFMYVLLFIPVSGHVVLLFSPVIAIDSTYRRLCTPAMAFLSN